MVDKITKVSSSSPSTATRVESSLSLAEPDAAWVAHRQSAINAAIEKRKRDDGAAHERASPAETDADSVPGRDVDDEGSDAAPTNKESAELLSGESERIGSGNLDEDVPFGQHVGYV